MIKQIKTSIIENKPEFQQYSIYRSTNSLIPQGESSVLIYQTEINHHQYAYHYAEGNTNGFCVEITLDGKKIDRLRDIAYLTFFTDVSKIVSPDLMLHDLKLIRDQTTYGQIDTDTMDKIKMLMEDYKRYELPSKVNEAIEAIYEYLYLAFTAEYYYVTWAGSLSKIGPDIKLLAFKQALMQEMDSTIASNWSRGRAFGEITDEVTKMYDQLGWKKDLLMF